MSRWHLIFELFFLNLVFAKKAIFFYQKPQLNFDKNFLNISCDFSIYENGTKENPIEVLPEINAVFFKDVNIFTGSFSVTDVNSGQILIEQQFNICSWTKKSIFGYFLRPIIDLIENSSNFKIQCPFKKDKLMKIKQFDLKRFPFANFLPANKKRAVKITFNQGQKREEIICLVFYYMKVEINE
ncbi:hypothetical protein PVAND_015646 [Polypedilum vanderplanki]|uniref:MD-2-related lipid-recognition domain-containing protein n=1 Tax=Polypedilum vanderplanki TaxID=319348 RepID=A0A9J6BD94_POLVA|nr:hypothetical protein PVAND_015646 [Polypedilum vanderplanki]